MGVDIPMARKKLHRLQSVFKMSSKAGASPGTLLYTGQPQASTTQLELYSYSPDALRQTTALQFSDILPHLEPEMVHWLNIDALHDTALIEQIGNHFGIHPLILEDILNTEQLPKMEDAEHYLYLTLKMLHLSPDSGEITYEHVSFILGKNYVLSFQEKTGDVFAAIRQRLAIATGRVRQRQADYLLFALMDVVVDHYYLVLEHTGENIEAIEEELIDMPSHTVMERIFAYRNKLIHLRKALYPLRDTLRKMSGEEFALIEDRTGKYFDDVYDHVNHIISTLEIQRETLTGLMDLYMSTISNQMNNVMRTLTVIATIFIPLTFIAGVYGMNFKLMPELDWPWGYPVALASMAALGIGMYVYMRRKHWF